ncbi:MAG: SpoIID/LytB domain-containing protein, partial [Candidatus Krumholzibacteria bacterium]|nr:SpoIID/LytB domain-containing protein [Candidatus Krumholzibacteria bacterium]
MKLFDRRSFAALFFCVLVLSSCGEKRAGMHGRPGEAAPSGEALPVGRQPIGGERSAGEAQPAGQPPAVETARPPVVSAEAPRVRVLILGAQQAVRVHIPAPFLVGVDVSGEPLARIDRGGDYTVRVVGGEAVLAAGKRRVISSGSVLVKAEGAEKVPVNGRPYRGIVLFRAGTGGVMTINILDIDDYIKGVLPSE